jgi:RNA polymerase sigma factor (sigma-70 family)
VNAQTDLQLLRAYAEHRSEPAFTELVRRHVDFVHSAARRMVCDSHLAQDVTQGVFVALAKNAGQLTDRPVLSGWLHRTAQNLAAQTVRTDVRRRVREQEAATMNELPATAPDASWDEIAPHLDAALGELSEPDRDAVLLRYFEKKSAAEIAGRLGTSSEAAQKRVNRAVERLREFFAKRGVTVGAGGLVVVISANAVQAAPVGLAVTISAAALAGTTVTTSTLIAATTKTIAMTTLQKTLVTATVAVLAGAGIYEARQAAQLRDQVHTLQQQQAPLAEQIQKLQGELVAASNRVAGLRDDLAKATKNNAELLKLRGEVGVLRAQLGEAMTDKKQSEQPPLETARDYYKRADRHGMNREFEAQLEDLNKAIELDPNMAEAYLMRGNLYSMNLPKERGGDEKAVADFTSCLNLKPDDLSARWNRATHYRSLGKADEAIVDWTVIIQGGVDFSRQLEGKTKTIAGALVWRGVNYQQAKKDYLKAIADYTAAIELNPNAEFAHRSRGECYELLGETEKAQADFAIEPKR